MQAPSVFRNFLVQANASDVQIPRTLALQVFPEENLSFFHHLEDYQCETWADRMSNLYKWLQLFPCPFEKQKYSCQSKLKSRRIVWRSMSHQLQDEIIQEMHTTIHSHTHTPTHPHTIFIFIFHVITHLNF